ncbi:MAG: NuoF family protein [Planctomycetota bacterium]
MELFDLKAVAEEEQLKAPPVTLRCCVAAGCLSTNSSGVLQGLQAAVKSRGLENRVGVAGVGCLRLCSQGPLVKVDPTGDLFEQVKPIDADSIVASLEGTGEATARRGDPSMPFFARQTSLVLENCGVVEPERIESSLARGAYQALYHALRECSPSEVVDQITASGLRGRGGAGYPTGIKWSLVAKSKADRKFVVCNADEGDPGAFMNRSELESDPHRILEGMAIAGYAVGASQGFIYVRGEYPLAIHRLQVAIRQATRYRLLGTQIFGSPFNFRIDLRIGAGAFVCGEETALMASIEGNRGTPRPRPPYPAEAGLWGCPTLINNVETFANIAPIMDRGAEWFAGIGTGTSKGTKVFALTGKVRHTGLVEVPMGTTIRTVVEEIGGGTEDSRGVKAVQTGGPSGGCIPTEHFDTPLDYESLKKLGSIMGSGGMIVLDHDDRMVDVARFFMEFCRDESCGKCIPCRAGTVQMHDLLTRILQGRARAHDLQVLEDLCDMVGQTSLCGLGQTAPNPVLSTLRFFRHEYLELLQPPITNGSDHSLPILQ